MRRYHASGTFLVPHALRLPHTSRGRLLRCLRMRLPLPLAALIFSTWLGGCGSSPAPCEEGAWTCSEDGLVLHLCAGGAWQEISCQADLGQICEQGACVDPWRYGSPTWDRCEDDPLAVPASLHAKMTYYEDIARRVHVHPPLKWMLGVSLACRSRACDPGETPPCEDCSEPAVPEEQATADDVVTWHTGENDGLWSSLYLTSQAYRYAVTRDATSLDMINLLLEGELDRMAITGVEGLFTRQLIPPGVPGIACPTDPARYVPDREKDDNQWVRVGPDGCIQTADPDTLEFVSSDVCGLDAYAGWCWLDNVSQDEYSGHMLALAAVAALVDDPTAQAMAADLLGQVAHHLMDNDLEIYDWDGRRTEHGMLWPPFIMGGYGAAQILGYFAAAVLATDDPEIQTYYDECLLQRSGQGSCWAGDDARAQDPFPDLLGDIILYFGLQGCQSNWNNFAMYMLYLHTLLLTEHDPWIVRKAQDALDAIFRPEDEERPLSEQHNALYDFQFAALKWLGPGSDGPGYEYVRDGICQLRQFPERLSQPDLECPATTCVADDCQDRFGEPLSVNPRQTAERCPHTFLWWGNPYRMEGCTADPRRIYPPASYLLPYWMGRYYGFIDPTM